MYILRLPTRALIALCLAALFSVTGVRVYAADDSQQPSLWLPQITVESDEPFVNLQDRQTSLDLYRTVYAPTTDVQVAWSGAYDSCDAGETSSEYKAAVLSRVNYFRAMAGVPANIVFSPQYNNMAQDAALMMSRNATLDHNPPSTWACYTEDGATAAGLSNISIGYHGIDAVTSQMAEYGDNNYKAGHRRWLLCPQSQYFGTGDVTGVDDNSFRPANALWVVDQEHYYDSRPNTREEFVAWPPPGYVPAPVVFPRWSFSYAGADFSSASVSMTSDGQPIGVRLENLADNMCEPTLVWAPEVDWQSLDLSADRTFEVTVHNVRVGGESRTFAYTVVVFGI